MKPKFLSSIIALLGILAILPSCSTDQPDPEPSAFVEAPKCDGTVTVAVSDDDTRASSVDNSIDRYTATSVRHEGANLVVVTYHGRNQEQIGMVQIVRADNGKVMSELNTLDARINFCFYRKVDGIETAYIGVDRTIGDKPLCGILAIPLEKGLFPKSLNYAELTPYKVKGASLNCIKFAPTYGDYHLIVAAGGNNSLGMDEAGFTKFSINKEDPTKLGLAAEYTLPNFRGYWVSYDFIGSGSPFAYTYRTVEDGELVYKMGMIENKTARKLYTQDDFFIGSPDANALETEVWRRSDTNVDLGRFGTSTIQLDGTSYIVVCTGSKEGGVKVYRYRSADSQLILVDTWHKACNYISSLCTGADGENYMFACCGGGGLYKMRIDLNAEAKTVKLVPVGKRVSTVLTESGTLASTNYVHVYGSHLYVANGYEGYIRLSIDDSAFVPCEPRED